MNKAAIRSVDFTLDGAPYHARVAGRKDRPLLIFLHGFPEYSGAWHEVMERLADRFYCVAPDQRGYGKSQRPEGVAPYAAKHLCRDVAGFIEHFGQGYCTALVGHDWGAAVAYATAMRWPEKMATLINLNGVHPAPYQAALAAGGAQSEASQYINWLRAPGAAVALAKDDFAGLFAMFTSGEDWQWITPERRAEYRAAWGDVAGLQAMINWYRASPVKVATPGQPIAREDLPMWDKSALMIQMPHLLIWGLKDRALLPECRDGLAAYCADLTLRETDAADHWIAHQKPDFVADAIVGFLAEKGLADG